MPCPKDSCRRTDATLADKFRLRRKRCGFVPSTTKVAHASRADTQSPPMEKKHDVVPDQPIRKHGMLDKWLNKTITACRALQRYGGTHLRTRRNVPVEIPAPFLKESGVTVGGRRIPFVKRVHHFRQQEYKATKLQAIPETMPITEFARYRPGKSANKPSTTKSSGQKAKTRLRSSPSSRSKAKTPQYVTPSFADAWVTPHSPIRKSSSRSRTRR